MIYQKVKPLISIAVTITMLLSLIGFSLSNAAVQTQQPITFMYQNFESASGIKLNGNASFQTESGAQAVRLTDNKTWQNGSFYHGNYVSLAYNRSFSTMFSFKITNPQTGTSGADGIVFVVNTNTTNLGAIGGGIGYSGMVNSLGVEFDTWDNKNEYADAGMLTNHIAVNINGDSSRPIAKVSQAEIESFYGVPAGAFNFGNGNGNGNTAPLASKENTTYSWIDYDGINKVLTVRINNTNNRPEKAVITQHVDLGAVTTLTSDKVYVGFTGATGGCYSKEYIKSWYFNNDYVPTSIDINKNTYAEAPKITLTANPASDSTTSLITAVVKNADGAVMPGVPVSFSVLSGANAVFTTPTTVVTDANGVATAALDGSGVPIGRVVVNGALDFSIGGNNSTVTIEHFGKAEILPVISDSVIHAKKNSAYQFSGKEFTSQFTSSIQKIKIIALPPEASGVLKNNDVAVKAGDIISESTFNVLTFAIASAFTGSAPIQWQASTNGTDFSAAATMTFNITANRAPATVDYSITSKPNTPVSGAIVATDADGDMLLYAVTSTPVKGAVSIDSTTGLWTYTPNAGATGYDSFNVTISDGYGGTAYANVLLVITDTLTPPASAANPATGLLFESGFANKDGVIGIKGNWLIQNGLSPASGMEGRAFLENTNTDNYEITLDASAAGINGGYGIFFHATELQSISGYVFQFDKGASNSFLIRKFANGSELYSTFKSVPMSSVMGADFDLNATHRIVIRALHNEYIITVDGIEVIRFTDTTYTSGCVGLRSWSGINATFSNMKVVDLDIIPSPPSPTPTPIATPSPTPTPTPTTEPVPTIIPSVDPIVVPTVNFSYAYLYGYSNGLAAADETLKREEVSAVLYRILKQADRTGAYAPPSNPTYTDLPASTWSYAALEYMTSIGAVNGKNGKIKPADDISRGEMAKIMAVSMGIVPNGSYSKTFSDLNTNHPYYDYLMALAEVGLLKGYPNGTMQPDSALTRAEYINMVNRLIGRDSSYYVDDQVCPYPDLTPDHWAYKDILRASFGFSGLSDGNGYYKVDPAKKLPREQIDYN